MLDKYRVPTGVKEGVWIAAKEDETVKFLVKLPHRLNVKHRRALMDSVQLDAKGEIKNTLSSIESASTDMFLKHCLMDWQGVEIDGVPTAFNQKTAAVFFEEYPLLLEEIQAAAAQQASELEATQEEIQKNL